MSIETFFRNLSEKYRDWDITFYYEVADEKQLKEISKYCRCIKFSPAKFQGKKVVCDKAFFNFNLDMLPYVEAKEKILVVHGNYKWLGEPPMSDEIDTVVAVSKDAAEAYTELTGKKCGLCYNPLIYKEPEKLLKLVCACRIDDRVKGGKRLSTFVSRLDDYCNRTGKKYIMHVFGRGSSMSPNVVVMNPRLDIIPYMNDADYLLQFSDNVEGYCYSVNEMLTICKKPVVITPCNVFKELGIDDSMALFLDFEMSNVDEIIEQMFSRKWDVKYTPPVDSWDKLLAPGKSDYDGEKIMKVKCTQVFRDLQENKIREVGEIFEVNEARFEILKDLNLVELIPEVKKEVEDGAREKEVKRTTKKTTRQTK